MIIYESELVVLHRGDARDVLPTLGTETASVTIADPPYGQGWVSNTRGEAFAPIAGDATLSEAAALWAAVTPDIVRITRRSRHIYTFGLALAHPWARVKADLIWDKGRMGSGDLSCQWGPSFEPLFFHVRAADKTNADRGTGALAARLRKESVIRVRRLSAAQVKNHPTEKPVELMRQLVESSSQPGDVVFDPFAGSGATLVAAVLTGRRAVGVELDPGYCEVIVRRLRVAERIAKEMAAT